MLLYKNKTFTILDSTILILKEDKRVTINSHIHNPVGKSIVLSKGTKCIFDRTNDWDNTFFKTLEDNIEFKLQFHPDYISKYFDIV